MDIDSHKDVKTEIVKEAVGSQCLFNFLAKDLKSGLDDV